jgi:carboxymethylenebutenolidase
VLTQHNQLEAIMAKPVITQEMIYLYDEYTHAPLPRRVFLRRLAALAGSTAAATAILPYIETSRAAAAIVAVDDARIETSHMTYPGSSGPVKAYLAKAKEGAARRGSVIVIHENRGLSPHIEDVARRAALEGFVAVAPDLLSYQGGTPANDDDARAAFAKMDRAVAVKDAAAAIAYLKGRPDSNGKVGMVGFCWGGGTVIRVATIAPDLVAAVPFYGDPPPADDVKKIKAKMLMHYAALDQRINAMVPAYEAALKEAHIPYTMYIYEGVNHAFHNDTAGERYGEAQAKLAWSRTVAFFKENLS